MQKLGLYFVFTMFLLIIVPGIITFSLGTEASYDLAEPLMKNPNYDKGNKITVFNPETSAKDEMNLEQYICGVVAAEMPAQFHMDALKAQAVAARTYAARRMKDSHNITNEDIENINQAFLPIDELELRWGDDFRENYDRISEAVRATEGEIMIYEDIPIEAVFHSTSAGKTENAENVWQKQYPYLKSVESNEDILSPEYMSEKVFTNGEVLDLLRQNFKGLYLTEGSFLSQFQIVERSSAGYVESVQVGNSILTGRQIREALGLKSTAFTVKQEGDSIVFSTKGYGHGVGMSQYGANVMAENGLSYRDILNHYYSNISFDTILK